MIKINKNLSQIPESLKPATSEFYANLSKIPKSTRTTHMHRMKMINDGKYIDKPKYNGRYKYKDVRLALNQIYFGKCAYCEQKIEQSHVEHYRPKSKYYWLSFSWDNLMLACPHCNEFKKDHFDLMGTVEIFSNTSTDITNINSLSNSYDLKELPMMMNLEVTDPSQYLKFNLDGGVESDHESLNYTIETCRISRTYLRDERRKLLNDFRDDVAAELLHQSKQKRLAGIEAIIKKFIRDSKKNDNTYIAFRTYAIKNGWLTQIFNDIL